MRLSAIPLLMNTNIALFGRIAARSFLSWLSVVLPGILLSVMGLIISIFLLAHQPGPGFAGARAGGIGALMGLLMLLNVSFWTTSLFVLSLAGFVLFPSLASGYTLKKALFLCWEYKLGDYFVDKIGGYVDRIGSRTGNGQASSAAGGTLKKEPVRNLKAEVQKDAGTNKLQKRILNHLLKKANLNGINWSAPLPAIKDAVLAKVKAYIGEKIKPTALWIRLAMALYIVIMVLVVIGDH